MGVVTHIFSGTNDLKCKKAWRKLVFEFPNDSGPYATSLICANSM